MVFLINVAAFFLCWFGCIAAYLASDRQLMLAQQISKRLGWLIFSVGAFSAFILLLNLHHWLSALLTLIVLIMLAWIVLALVVPYFPHQRKTLVYGTTLTMITALIGGVYVV